MPLPERQGEMAVVSGFRWDFADPSRDFAGTQKLKPHDPGKWGIVEEQRGWHLGRWNGPSCPCISKAQDFCWDYVSLFYLFHWTISQHLKIRNHWGKKKFLMLLYSALLSAIKWVSSHQYKYVSRKVMLDMPSLSKLVSPFSSRFGLALTERAKFGFSAVCPACNLRQHSSFQIPVVLRTRWRLKKERTP